MTKSLKQILAALAAFVLIYAAASLLVTIAQLASAADRVHLGAGQFVFWFLLILFAVLAATPAILFLRLPKPLRPPVAQVEPAYSEYLERLLESLRRNPRLSEQSLTNISDVPIALERLGALADDAARAAASGTFISTALMQNGRLDSLIVLASQLRLVWQVMSIYHLRPTPRQALYVYANVGGALLVANSLEDVDFAEITSPLLNAVAPALAASVPGLGGISRLVANSLANGAANAFLTLRVAMLTKQYCQALVCPEPSAVRRSASMDALALLTEVSRDSGARVVKAVFKSAGQVVSGTAGTAAQGVAKAMSKGVNAAGDQVKKVGHAAGRAASASAESISMLGEKIAGLGRKPTQYDSDSPTLPPKES